MKLNDDRLEQLDSWLGQQSELDKYELTPASSDASFRRYFRVSSTNKSYIAMDAPPEKENSKPFVAIAALLYDSGINVPKIFQKDFELGFFLISDLGKQQYLAALNKTSFEALYQSAIQTVLDIQQIPRDKLIDIPDYNLPLLLLEMALFKEWYLERHLGIYLNSSQEDIVANAFNLLTDSALAQNQVLVHRDYHSRNLMVSENTNLGYNKPGVLDFQDAVIGPFTYDLVSLLRDCYINWPEQQTINLALYYKTIAVERKIIPEVNDDVFLKYFDLMGIQRHLKAIGIFSRLNYRDNKPSYLDDIPRTLSYVKNISSKYQELQAFNRFLNSII